MPDRTQRFGPEGQPINTTATRPYTAADRAALPKMRRNDVERIREASDRHEADFRAALALGTATYWVAAGAPDEAHRMIAEAAALHIEVTR